MKLTNKLDELLQRELSLLYRKSLVRRCLLWLSTLRIPLLRNVTSRIDDQVSPLESSALGMYIYNLRALFMFIGGVFLVGLSTVSFVLNWWRFPEVVSIISVLWVVLIVTVFITLGMHRDFRQRLAEYERKRFAGIHELFQRYFVLDLLVLGTAIIAGKHIWHLSIEALVFLVVANLFVYSAYMGGEVSTASANINLRTSLFWPFVVVTAFVSWFVGQVSLSSVDLTPKWFYILLFWVPILASVAAGILSAGMISFLRRKEYHSSQETLDFILTLVTSINDPTRFHSSESESNPIRVGTTSLLKSICSLQNPHRYRGARMWTLIDGVSRESRQSMQFYPTAVYPATFAKDLPPQFDALNVSEIQASRENIYPDRLYVPIVNGIDRVGTLELLRAQPALLTQNEIDLLSSIAKTVFFANRLLHARHEAVALQEVDNILKATSLEQALQETTTLLRKHLAAQGSMLLLVNKTTEDLDLAAQEGFALEYLRRSHYRIGQGLTGQCVASGELIRVDDVMREVDRFDAALLSNLSLALGEEVRSWMAIPIGIGKDVLGVVKVVNKLPSSGLCFTNSDEQLAIGLALKLKLVLENSINLDKARAAELEAIERAEIADSEKEKATMLANNRQQDLVILSHQLQGPLQASMGRVALVLEQDTISRWLRKHLEFCDALLQDALDLIFGILVATGLDAGSPPYFSEEKVIASQEVAALCERIQQTANRSDLRFSYSQSDGFPELRIDRRLLRSVLYTLIHNATKYSDLRSTINIECGFEWPANDESLLHPAIKVKSIGPPIHWSEKESIFEKYYRGVNVRNTGRYGASIGLGLWVARRLMRSTKGELTLELSNDNARLSIFVVDFPGQRK